MGFGGGSGERGGRCDARRQPLLLSLGGAACIASSPLPVVTSSAHRRLNVVTTGPLVSSSLQGGSTLAAVAAAAASLVRTVGQVAAQPAASISPSPRGLDLFVRGVSSVLRKVLVSRPVDLSPLRLPLLFFLTWPPVCPGSLDGHETVCLQSRSRPSNQNCAVLFDVPIGHARIFFATSID